MMWRLWWDETREDLAEWYQLFSMYWRSWMDEERNRRKLREYTRAKWHEHKWLL